MNLEDAIAKLREHKINPWQEVLKKTDSQELVSLIVHWSPITKSAGKEKITDIIGDSFNIHWLPNQAYFKITVKK